MLEIMIRDGVFGYNSENAKTVCFYRFLSYQRLHFSRICKEMSCRKDLSVLRLFNGILCHPYANF